ncbi:ATP-binding protein [Dethiobacter alkaliphilus]|uniref:4Fe-4S ferredoxin iron-sulfur binding domain protein n=1 Tax=Dethiobacter alkaliphilus AHT 1 TaxID=555088 RepID=C0GC34_DETAL|nr:4Fe-4S binding protein [Dethiobacter alkaliphilus]EEG78769.1 4Fe-4S ferredoxin iron-sulfur binding domain protein [Dethiobacter alkaliphilus AHT 1]
MKRQIVRIDENKCDGCGQCIPACAEGALQIVNGKARLIEDKLCDGLGECLGNCPQDALIIEERDADAFDEEAVEKHLEEQKKTQAQEQQPLGCGCPGTMARTMAPKKDAKPVTAEGETPSELGQWPVQLKLVNPAASYFKNADLLVAADCAPFAYADFHKDFLSGRALAIGCPKLDDAMSYVEKLAEIIRVNNLNSITVAHMEVPCCSGLISIVREAVKRAGVDIPVQTVKISLDGTANQPQKLSA